MTFHLLGFFHWTVCNFFFCCVTMKTIYSRSRVLVVFFKLYKGTSVSREKVSTKFDCGRISVIVHRSASNKLAVDLLVLLVWNWVLFLQREMTKSVCLANYFQSKICELVSGKFSKCLYIHSYAYVVTSSALNECLLLHNFKDSCSTKCHW